VRAGGHEWSGKYLLATVGRHAPWWQKDSPAGAAESERFVGLKAHFAGANLEDGVTEMHAWDGGYCGLLRVEGGATNACLLARYESLAGRSPQEFWDALLRERPALRERMGRADLMFPWLATANVCFSPTTPLRRLRNVPGGAQVLGEQVMCAGDAAGFIHPLTGDGMAMALRGGELAAATLVGALQNNWGEGEAQELWARVWEREFASRLRWSRALQATVITPQVSRVAWPAFAALPQMARLAIRKTRGVMA
jgi:2-polyprenyl-6-methoxyphenol hydroxylase-like FAD-dependent oxidoreductase